MIQQINPETSSPCNGFCELDKSKKYCKGCLRTMTEIVSWQMLSDHEKLEVLRSIKKRKEKMKHN